MDSDKLPEPLKRAMDAIIRTMTEELKPLSVESRDAIIDVLIGELMELQICGTVR